MAKYKFKIIEKIQGYRVSEYEVEADSEESALNIMIPEYKEERDDDLVDSRIVTDDEESYCYEGLYIVKENGDDELLEINFNNNRIDDITV